MTLNPTTPATTRSTTTLARIRRLVRRFRRALLGAAAAAAILATATPARAAVTLMLTDNDSTPNAVALSAGQSFSVDVDVTSTSEKLTGVDYYLQASGTAAGKFNLTARDLGTSPFVDTLKLDSEVTGPIVGLTDLGATVNNVSVSLTAGTYLLARYTIAIPAGMAPGTYTLSTFDPPGTGVVREAPTFNEQAFDQHAAFTVTVTPTVLLPEPAAAGILAAGAMGVGLRRRKR